MVKKILSLIMVGVLSVSMTGCLSGEIIDELLAYEDESVVQDENEFVINGVAYKRSEKRNKVIFENNFCKITYKGYENNEATGAFIYLNVVNKTNEKITVVGKDFSLNNKMISEYFLSDITVGKQSDETLWVSDKLIAASDLDMLEATFETYGEDFNYDFIVENTVKFCLDN